ncbi:ATP-binding protein [Micromonospora viridifaciens]|uniref:ATP-binding protein n=1 Tax=Micromonospora viridifaciens TaxID=1881 RepID=UPI000B5AC88C|nr:AAA family ATPase [Micromonospora viridifaciens]
MTEPDRVSIAVPRLVGREREFAEVSAALDVPAAVVFVQGEAGVGKTRLVDEALAQRERPGRVLRTACPALLQPFTLGPLVDALRIAVDAGADHSLSALAGDLRPLFPEWAEWLPPMPEPADDPAMARHRVFRAVTELLDLLAVELLVVEDVHWADEATLEFLLLLACGPPPRPGILLTYRPEDVPRDSLLPRLTTAQLPHGRSVRIALEPLPLDDVARMVSSMLGGETVSGAFAAFLLERTAGLPLAVEESMRLMWNRGDLVRRGDAWARHRITEIDVPPTVRDAVLARAAGLGDAARAALRAAAVLTETSSESTVLAVMSGDPAGRISGLAEAVASGLLAEDAAGMVSFRHMLACLAIYEAIPMPERRAMHLRASRALADASPAPLAQLTRHAKEGGDAKAWGAYAELSADRALESGDGSTALVVLHDLLVHGTPAAGDVVRLTDKYPFGLLSGHERYAELLAALRRVVDSGAASPAEEAEIRFQIARLLTQMEAFEDARSEMERALPGLGHNPPKAARAAMYLGLLSYGTSTPARELLHWLRQASRIPTDAMSEADRLSMVVGLASGLLVLGEEDGWAEAAKIGDDAATTAERMAVSAGKLNVGEMAVIWGRHDEARRALMTVIDLAARHGFDKDDRLARATLALLDWVSGDWEGLAERAKELAGDEELLQPVSRLAPATVVGLLQAARGERDQAEQTLRAVLRRADELGGAESSIGPASALAGIRLAAGDVEDVLRLTEAPIAFLAGKGNWIWATDLAQVRVEALLAAGRTAEAIELIDAFERGIEERHAPAPRAALAVCHALVLALDEPLAAAAAFEQAAAAWQAIPRPYDTLRSREAQASCLVRAGATESGVALLTEVFAALSELGARATAERVRGELRAHGAPVKRPAWKGAVARTATGSRRASSTSSGCWSRGGPTGRSATCWCCRPRPSPGTWRRRCAR